LEEENSNTSASVTVWWSCHYTV